MTGEFFFYKSSLTPSERINKASDTSLVEMADKKNDTLLVFTEVYPYGIVAESFLDREIIQLSTFFKKIIIIPTIISKPGDSIERKLPDNVVVDTSYLQVPDAHRMENAPKRIFMLLVSVLRSGHFYREIAEHLPLTLHPTALVSLRDNLYIALQTEKWILDFLKTSTVDLSTTVFYTYWLSGVTTGLGFAKKKYPEMKLVSRAHGGDLYLERHNPPYIPGRPAIFPFLTKVFLVSKDGQRYLSDNYPAFSDTFELALLGVQDPGFMTTPSPDTIFRIVSCSYLRPVKRTALLIQGLKELGEMKKNCRFIWVHIGGGPLQEELENLAGRILPENVRYNFLGFLTNADVIRFYKDNPVDVFINVSKSEGGNPVSIMEAQSCGIPVIATGVGGNKEIVSDEVGVLLCANPDPQEIASAIGDFLENRSSIPDRKQKSKLNWKNNYNPGQNFLKFAWRLQEL